MIEIILIIIAAIIGTIVESFFGVFGVSKRIVKILESMKRSLEKTLKRKEIKNLLPIEELLRPYEKVNQLLALSGKSYFAIDDCIQLVCERTYKGWDDKDIDLDIVQMEESFPPDIKKIIQQRLPLFAGTKNIPKYRLVDYHPVISDKVDKFKATLIPTDYHTYKAIWPILDNSNRVDDYFVILQDGMKGTIREKYGLEALEPSSSKLPSIACLHMIVISNDRPDPYVVLMRRSKYVDFYPKQWSISYEEQMNGEYTDEKGIRHPPDKDFFDTIVRGAKEEFGENLNIKREDAKILSINLEFDNLGIAIIGIIKIENTIEEIEESWVHEAFDKYEADTFDAQPFNLKTLCPILLEGTYRSSSRLLKKHRFELLNKIGSVSFRDFPATKVHPTSRMRLLLALYNKFGVKETREHLNLARAAR